MGTMLSEALREFTTGPLNQLIVNLGGQDGDQWEQELKRFLRKEPCWTNVKFVAKDRFVVNTNRNALVKISYIGNNFQTWMPCMLSDTMGTTGLKSFLLETDTFDKDIIVRIGGVQKAITSLAEVWGEMKKQPDGPKGLAGKLLTNGYANIFYVPQAVKKLSENRFSYVDLAGVEIEENLADTQYLFEINGQWFVLRAVCVYWDDDGWDVNAFSVEDPCRWGDGDQVFSRNSVLESSEPSAPAQA